MNADTQIPPDFAGSILVIRRDNIGDLVCTTPLIRALRHQLPAARIAVLANRYNEAVLRGNPDIDAVYAYTKAKHRTNGVSLLSAYWDRLRTTLAMRQESFDWVLLPGGHQASALRFARWVGGRHVMVRSAEDVAAGPHEVEQACHLLPRMGLRYETPNLRLAAPQAESSEIENRLAAALPQPLTCIIGLHISARKPSQQWPASRFVELAHRIHERESAGFMLLWAPGSADNAAHPGDDEKAAEILAATRDLPVVPVPTQRLEQLIAAVARCHAFVCGDGGAMHVAAGLGKPIVALFGRSPPERWRPWGVPHVVLRLPDGANVSGIRADVVQEALATLTF